MGVIQIQGSGPLQGEVRVQGSKNAVLPILAATLLIEGTCQIQNCPYISDADCMLQLLERMGCSTHRNQDVLYIDTTTLRENRLFGEMVTCMRSSIILLGPLLSRCKEAVLNYPGGCVIGERPIDIHLYLLEKMGAVFTLQEDRIKGEAASLTGTTVLLPFPSVGATENGILAAVLAKGTTTLLNCAKEPEIRQLCEFLTFAGAKIEGIGTDCLTITGVSKLYPVSYTVEADRIVAGSYLFSAVATRGHIGIVNAPVSELEEVLSVAEKMGCRITMDGKYMEVWQPDRAKAVPKVRTEVYPGFPTDLQSHLLVTLCVSEGESVIEETIFSNRFRIAKELGRMGADIMIADTDRSHAYLCGKDKLVGTTIEAEDLRGGAALVLAGICAEGESLIKNSHFIERGYEDICRDYRLLGVSIEKMN